MSSKKISQVYSTTLVEENGQLVDYCTLTIYKEKDTVEFSVISTNGNAYVGKQTYEDDEHWDETLKIIKKLPPITLYDKQSTAKIKRIGVKLTAVSLTDTQKLAFRVDALEKEIVNLRETARVKAEWVPLDALALGQFDFSANEPSSYKLPDNIPSSSSQVLVHLVIKTSNEVTAKVYTSNNGVQLYQLVHGHSSDKSLFAYSQNLWFPYNSEEPTIYVQSNDVVQNSSSIKLEVIGYR